MIIFKRKAIGISTAIDYPSSRFHLGHAYEKICTDVLARWLRLKGVDVHFSTGTDCHGLKIQKAAEKVKKKPLDFVNKMSDGFRELCKVLNISYDDFIMTVEPRHKKVASAIVEQLEKNGYLYKDRYSGPYCVDCETYYTEKDLVDGKCPIHKKTAEYVSEESYFFKMSRFQKALIKHIESNPDSIFPNSKRKEILNRLKDGLRDLSVTREKVTWGIPFPLDKKFSIFVWIEALINYLTTIGYPDKKYEKYWPSIHFIGTDIVWHHTAIWFSILSSLGLPLPQVVVHGFINLKGEKLSKAKGITIDPITLSEKYSSDALRYFLISEIPFGEDGDFSEKILKARINGELVSDLGNLVYRVLTLAEKFNGDIKGTPELDKKLNVEWVDKLMSQYKFNQAIDEIWKFVRAANKYINNNEPWKLEGKELGHVLYNLLEAIRIIGILISPFMPDTADKINKQLGIKAGTLKDVKFRPFKGKIKKDKYLFEKVE